MNVPPPHPRVKVQAEQQREPSPAPAGIHPRRARTTFTLTALPRTRGDPPRAGRKLYWKRSPPPHPRGSTLDALGHLPTADPSPAPAGIHPAGSSARVPRRPLPRTRGDPPRCARRFLPSKDPPPHPRGSTHHRRPAVACPGPSPAPAGIHPPRQPSHRPAPSLPRTRGDPPRAAFDEGLAPIPPPHPRGSTRLHRRAPRSSRPSPAPAGIHPSYSGQRSSSGPLPRTRGDPPHARNAAVAVRSPPPHPRGSTLFARVYPADPPPSPAPAGIHPTRRVRGRCSRALPRTRGDPPTSGMGPSFAICSARYAAIRFGSDSKRAAASRSHCQQGPSPSPAPAGIHPTCTSLALKFASLPRTRGDPPFARTPCARRSGPPPHPRGSTRGCEPEPRALAPSPAPAGIHPRSERFGAWPGPLPRTRGDPPATVAAKALANMKVRAHWS